MSVPGVIKRLRGLLCRLSDGRSSAPEKEERGEQGGNGSPARASQDGGAAVPARCPKAIMVIRNSQAAQNASKVSRDNKEPAATPKRIVKVHFSRPTRETIIIKSLDNEGRKEN